MSASPRADGAARAPKQFLLLGCDFNTGNLGVSALASGTIASILHAFPQAQIRLFDYGKEPRTYQERGSAGASAVRLVNKEGDVIWATTQESLGAKFRGASTDVADKITAKLKEDFARARKLVTTTTTAVPPGGSTQQQQLGQLARKQQ